MKLKFIGTGSISSPNTSASYLINDSILVDCGSGVVKKMINLGIDFSKIKYVFITHLHGDHVFDLPFLLYQMEKIGVRDVITFIGPKELEKKMKRLTKEAFTRYSNTIYKNCSFKFIDAAKFKDSINEVSVEAKAVIHGKMKPSYGYRFNDLFISGDAIYSEVIDEMCLNNKKVILDCSLSKENDTHMGVDNIKVISDKYKDIVIYPTHMGVKAYSKLIKTLFKNKNVIIPVDGDNIKF